MNKIITLFGRKVNPFPLLKKALPLLVFAFLFATQFAHATISTQVTVTSTSGSSTFANYSTLGAAFAKINDGTHKGVINITINASTSEGSTLATLNSTGGTASYTAVHIKPASGVSPTISGSGTTGVIKLNGADSVTIDGSNAANDTSHNLTITTTSNNNSSSSLIWIASASSSNGATNNIIKNCILTGNASTTTIACIAASGSGFLTAAQVGNSNNTIQNNILSNAQSGIEIAGYATSTFDQSWSITGNTISNLSTNGISISNTGNLTISNNTISAVSTSSHSAPAGIFLQSSISTANIYNNTISGIANSDRGAYGLYLSPNTTTSGINVYNNFISNVTAGTNASGAQIDRNGFGIYVDDGGGYNIYDNSINQSVTQSSGISAAICFNGVSTASSVNLKDNILVNTESTGSTRYGIYSTDAKTIFASMDYNDYSVTGGNLGHIGSNTETTIAAMASDFGGNTKSKTAAPTFISSTDLHLTTTVLANSALQSGIAISTPSITTDIDGNARSSRPTIGADEASISPVITYTAITTPLCLSSGNINLTAVKVADSLGIYAAGTLMPRVYYKKGAGTWFSNPGTFTAGGTVRLGTWSFVIIAADMGGLADGDVVSYYVVAQDTAANVASTPTTGFAATDVNTVTTAPTTPNTVTINNPVITIPNSPACLGATSASLTYTGASASISTYSIVWNSAALAKGFTNRSATTLPSPTTGTISVTIPGATIATTYTGVLTVSTTGACTSANTINVVINAVPFISSVTTSNPTTCSGTNGTITLAGLTASTAYTLNYLSGSTPVSAPVTTTASGTYIITGLSAGSYSNIYVTSGAGCSSSTKAGPYVLSNPPTPTISSVTSTNPTICSSPNGTITLVGLTASTSYTLNYLSGSTPVSGSISTTGSGTYTITGLSAGNYSGFNVTSGAGCTSATVSGTTTLASPPAPAIASVTSTNPTTCSGTNGTITLTGLSASAMYTLHYISGSTPVSAFGTTNGSGNYTITGLNAGSYSGFYVTSSASGCTSATVSGTTTLTDPSTPSIASVTSTNPTTCSGTNGSITLTGLAASTSYTVNYINGSTPVSVSIGSNPSGNAVITGLSAGAYSGFYVTSTGCTSATVSGTTTLTDPPTPVITSVTPTNPTTCSGTDGTITLFGLTASVSYTVNYINGSTPVSTSVATDASGNAVVTDLSAGVYSGFNVTSTVGCTSATVSGTATLTDPPTPTIATVTSTNPTTCSGTNGSITLTGLAASISYSVNYINGSTPVSTSIATDASGNAVITGLNAGIYSGFNVTSGVGCTSATVSGTTTLTDPPTPVIATVTSTNPTTCSGTDGTITLTGLTASVSYTVNYINGSNPVSTSVATDASGNAVITGLNAGNYSGFYVTSGASCISATVSGTTTLTDPPAPTAFISGNTVACTSSPASVIFTGDANDVVYYNINGTSTLSIALDGTGTATLTPTLDLGATTYNLISVTSPATCSSSLTGSLTINAYTQGTWIGGTSNDWSNTANWACNTLPTSVTNTTIPAGTAFSPSVLSGTVSTNDLSIASGAVVTIASGAQLNVNGNLADAGSVAGDGQLVITGASTHNLTSTGTINNLTINTATGATIPAGNLVQITGTLIAATGTLTTNGNLTLVSNASGTGRIGNSAGTVSGNVNVQQYFPGGYRAYRFFGHPFNVSIPLSQLETYIDITGVGGISHGFTATATNATSCMWYSTRRGKSALSADPGWTAFTNANGLDTNAFKPYEGIYLMIRGAKGTGLDGLPYTPAPVTVSMTGTINQGTVAIPLAKGANSDFNQVSNPYPSPVDLGSVVAAAHTSGNVVGAAFYMWSPYRATGGAFVIVPIGSSYKIQGNASFQVEAATASSVLTFHETDKVNVADTELLRAANQYVGIEVVDANNTVWDDLKIKFDAQETDAKDNDDAGKPVNPDLNFYTLSPAGDHMSIDARPYADGKVIPLGLTTNHQQSFVIRATDIAAPVGAQLYLHDKYLSSYTPLTQGTEYPFTVSSDVKTQDDARFEIGLGAIPDGNNTIAGTSFGMNVTPNPATSQVVLSYQTSGKDDTHVRVLNVAGVEVTTLDLGKQSSGNVTIPVNKLSAGIYIVELTSGDAKTTQRLIKD